VHPARVAVNLSPAQFRVEDLAAEIADVLARTRLPAGRLEIEVTESLIIDHPDRVRTTMRTLKAMGVRISLDDFGTGYASLSYLRRFPFDKMKVDRSFVQSLGQDDAALPLFRAVLSLGDSLGMDVLAEGVETEAQLEMLGGMGCPYVQGYLLGRPMPSEELGEFLGAASGGRISEAAEAAE
jgi:EAL domain-containing protein (putative c-di-GMP-specific phosphodiesterase class I)